MELSANVQVHEPVVLLRPEMISIGTGSRIDSFVKIEGGRGVQIGRCVHVASFCHIGVGGGTVIIGDYANLSSGAKVLSAVTRPESRCISAASPREWQDIDYRVTRIGPNACLYTNAVVLPGRTIGEGAVIAAGAVVTRDVPPWEIWAGVPARKLGERPVQSLPPVGDELA
jgi:acetyltransferase-like isoleucine patch superfamily enzyme